MEWVDDGGSRPAAWSYVPVQSSSCSLRVLYRTLAVGKTLIESLLKKKHFSPRNHSVALTFHNFCCLALRQTKLEQLIDEDARALSSAEGSPGARPGLQTRLDIDDPDIIISGATNTRISRQQVGLARLQQGVLFENRPALCFCNYIAIYYCLYNIATYLIPYQRYCLKKNYV